MKVAFRTDASLEMGSGHVVRCLALADSLSNYGADCVFICREHTGNLIELIRGNGFDVHILPRDLDWQVGAVSAVGDRQFYNGMLGTDSSTDADQTLSAIRHDKIDCLVVDHYALDWQWEGQLKAAVGRMMVIDDLADRSHDCDLLLDQNFGRSGVAYAGLVPEYCQTLMGAEFALLRPEFAAMRDISLQRRDNPRVEQILVTMGGTDHGNATCHVLESLKTCTAAETYKIVVVMGRTAAHLSDVERVALQMPCTTDVMVDVKEMAKLMSNSDVAISSAGTTIWELCCLGVPAILITVAKNQESGALRLSRAGVAKLLGKDCDGLASLPGVFEHFTDGRNLERVSLAAREVTDGNGAAKVSRLILSSDRR